MTAEPIHDDDDGAPRTVGIRMLNQQTRQVLDVVREGHPVVVTDHGRPIARIVPVGLSPLERLIAEGEYVGAADSSIADPPPVSTTGKPSTAESLDATRGDRA